MNTQPTGIFDGTLQPVALAIELLRVAEEIYEININIICDKELVASLAQAKFRKQKSPNVQPTPSTPSTQPSGPMATSGRRRRSVWTPFSYFWFKDLVREAISYRYFADAVLLAFAFISLALAFKFYSLPIAIVLIAIIIGVALIHPLLGLLVMLLFSYPPIIYQAPLLGWVFSILVIIALFAGFMHYRTLSLLFSLIMLPLSPLGALLELPTFIIAVFVLGIKRASLATLGAFIALAVFSGLSGISTSAPILFNTTQANAAVKANPAGIYLIPSKPMPALGNFTQSLTNSISEFFSIKVASDLSAGFALAGYAIAYLTPLLVVQLIIWEILVFAMASYAIKEKSEFKGTKASLLSLAIPIVYVILGVLTRAAMTPILAFIGFGVGVLMVFLFESQNIEIVKALDVMKQDFLSKFGDVGNALVTPTETFADVADYDNVKKELIEAVITPIEHREITGAYGVTPAKGILLFGPPGTGKTLLMRALANEIRAGFLYISAPTLLSAYPGESSDAIKKIFETAKKHAPAVLFIDEIDAIARSRAGEISESVREALTALLTNMDGFLKTPGVVVVGATNAPQLLDPALLRPGRFDKAIYLRLPDQKGREEILRYYFSKLPVSNDIDYEKLAEMTQRFSGADIKHLAEEVAREVSEEALKEKKVLQITMDDIVSVLKHVKPSTSLAKIEEYNTFELDFERMLHPEKAEEPEKGKISLDDVVDLQEAKKALFEAVEVPILHPDLVKKYGVENIHGILLFGPPGTGKTMLMRAIANELGDVHFIGLSGSDLSKAGIENAVNTIKEIFNRAKENEPSIIFVDEIDAIVPERGSTNQIGVEITGEFLQEFDKLTEEGNNVVVVAATNRPDVLDPAIIRSGRFDKLVYVGPPERDDRIALFKEYLENAPLSEDIDFEKLADMSPGYTGADIANICRQAKMNALEASIAKETETKIGMQDLVNIIKATRPSAPSNVLSRYLMFMSRYGRR